VIDARTGHPWWKDGDGGKAKAPAKVTASALVTHKDGTVTGGAGKVKVGSLAHENGKWVAHHGDGTTTKHASKPVALKAMAAHHNAAPAQPAPATTPHPPATTPASSATAPAAKPATAPAPPSSPAATAKMPAKITAASLVVHQDGTVAHKQTGAQAGTLTHEDGKWVAHHADGATTKHANRQAAVLAIAARHNKAAAAEQPAAATPAAKPDVKPAAVPKPSPEPAAKAAPVKAPVKAAVPQAKTEPSGSETFVKPADLTLRNDGSVVSKKTGAEAGAIRYIPGGLFEATHADGTTTTHKTTADAVKAIAGTTTTAAAARVPKPGELTTAAKQHLVSIWSNSFRYSNDSYVHGKEGKDFTHELHRLLATNKPPDKCGAGCQEAHKFLGLVDQDAEVQHGEVSRGITLPAADAERMFQPGKTMDMPAASWTTKPEWAQGFADKIAVPGNTKVILHTAPGAKGLDLSKLSLFSEGEVVTGGRYSVDKVQTANGVMNVYVTQKDFSAH